MNVCLFCYIGRAANWKHLRALKLMTSEGIVGKLGIILVSFEKIHPNFYARFTAWKAWEIVGMCSPSIDVEHAILTCSVPFPNE